MKKKLCALLALLLVTLAAAACAPQTPPASDGDEAESVEALAPADTDAADTADTDAADAEEKDYTTGTPWPDIDLEGVVTADTPTNVKDNFALYVNKDAILSLEIPEGYSCAGTMTNLDIQANADIKAMFLGDAPASHDAKLAWGLFRLMSDWDSRNALGVAPLKELADAVEAIDSLDALNAYFLETPVEKRLGSLWKVVSEVDFQDSSRHMLQIDDCGALLGDSAEYAELTDYGRIKKDAYTELARKMLVRLGYPEEEALRKIDNSFAFETMYASAVYTNEEQGGADYFTRIQNYYTREELKDAQGKLPILEYLQKVGFPENDVYMVVNPEYLKRMNELYTEENLPLIRDMFIVCGAIELAGSLDRECYEWLNDCNNAITGSSGILDDDTAFSQSVSSYLGWAVGRMYAETCLRQEDKERIEELTSEILDAYHGILQEADFLSDETRARALEKLDAIDLRILYPGNWEPYGFDGLDFDFPEDGGTLWEALQRIRAYSVAKIVKEHSEPVDKTKWYYPPQICNAAYNSQDNSIMILGAFAQGDMYDSAMSDEEMMGAVGYVIGHEISHAFDRIGAQFDKDGNMSNWWTEEDYAAFQERNAKLAAYFDAMSPWEGQRFYGSIMTGEACADMVGMKVLLRMAAEKEGFDYDAFFRAVARDWLTKEPLQSAYNRINNVHPMCYLRINCTLQQFDDFLDFYGIQEGDGMYLAPENRVCIW